MGEKTVCNKAIFCDIHDSEILSFLPLENYFKLSITWSEGDEVTWSGYMLLHGQ